MDKSSKKLKMGHVQDSPVATTMISNECMIYHMKVHIVSYDLGLKKFQNPYFAYSWTNEPRVEPRNGCNAILSRPSS